MIIFTLPKTPCVPRFIIPSSFVFKYAGIWIIAYTSNSWHARRCDRWCDNDARDKLWTVSAEKVSKGMGAVNNFHSYRLIIILSLYTTITGYKLTKWRHRTILYCDTTSMYSDCKYCKNLYICIYFLFFIWILTSVYLNKMIFC